MLLTAIDIVKVVKVLQNIIGKCPIVLNIRLDYVLFFDCFCLSSCKGVNQDIYFSSHYSNICTCWTNQKWKLRKKEKHIGDKNRHWPTTTKYKNQHTNVHAQESPFTCFPGFQLLYHIYQIGLLSAFRAQSLVTVEHCTIPSTPETWHKAKARSNLKAATVFACWLLSLKKW